MIFDNIMRTYFPNNLLTSSLVRNKRLVAESGYQDEMYNIFQSFDAFFL